MKSNFCLFHLNKNIVYVVHLFICRFLSDHQEEVWNQDNPNGIVPVVVSSDLVQGRNGLKLSEDQKSGIQFLWDRYDKQTGGILAHDMGMGKVRINKVFKSYRKKRKFS